MSAYRCPVDQRHAAPPLPHGGRTFAAHARQGDGHHHSRPLDGKAARNRHAHAARRRRLLSQRRDALRPSRRRRRAPLAAHELRPAGAAVPRRQDRPYPLQRQADGALRGGPRRNPRARRRSGDDRRSHVRRRHFRLLRQDFRRRRGRGGNPPDRARAAADPRRHGARRAAENDETVNAPQRRLVASAESNLPRGETYMGAPDQPGVGRQAVAAQQPAPQAQPAAAARRRPRPSPPRRPRPRSRSRRPRPTSPARPANLPTPPRRPDNLVAAVDAPLPPPRPAELARACPTSSRTAPSLALRPSSAETAALAYAAAAERRRPSAAAAPADAGFARRRPEQGRGPARGQGRQRADHAGPARPRRAAGHGDACAAKPGRVPKNGAGFAPALRSASKLDALAASTPPRAPQTGFGAQGHGRSAPIPSPRTTSRKRSVASVAGALWLIVC